MWLVCALLWLTVLPNHISRIPANEEILFYHDAKVINGQEALFPANHPLLVHPPLYLHLVALSLRLFGDSLISARLVGIVIYLVTAVLVYYIASLLTPDSDRRRYAAMSAVALYMASPLVIQGSLLLDIDNTILTLLLTVSVLMIIHPTWFTRRWYEPLFTLIITTLLWTKWTTPPALMGCGVLYFGLRSRDRFWPFLRICAIGSMLFLATWWLERSMSGGSPWQPVQHLINSVLVGSSSSGSGMMIPTLVKRFVRLTLWVSPFVLGMMGFIYIERLMQWSRRIADLTIMDFTLLYIAVIFTGYLLIGGTSYGFPRYHMPMMPVVCAVIGHHMSPLFFDALQNRFSWLAGAVFIGIFLFGVFIVPDPLYLTNFVYKATLILAPEDLTAVYLRMGGYVFLLMTLFFSSLFLFRWTLFRTSWR